jgi:hypothetical protein
MNGGGMGGGGGRGRGGYGGRGSGGGMMSEYNQLTIAQSGSAVKISGSSGRILAQSPGGSSSGDSSKSSEASEAAPSGTWQDNKYVVATQDDRGGKTTRTYALSQDGSQLTVATRIDSPRFNQPVSFRFVYDPVKNSNGAQ